MLCGGKGTGTLGVAIGRSIRVADLGSRDGLGVSVGLLLSVGVGLGDGGKPTVGDAIGDVAKAGGVGTGVGVSKGG